MLPPLVLSKRYVCVFIKLHITAQSSPVILLIVILYHLHWSSQGGINYTTCYENLRPDATSGQYSLNKFYLSPHCLALPSLLPSYFLDTLGRYLLNQSSPVYQYAFYFYHPSLPLFPQHVYNSSGICYNFSPLFHPLLSRPSLPINWLF